MDGGVGVRFNKTLIFFIAPIEFGLLFIKEFQLVPILLGSRWLPPSVCKLEDSFRHRKTFDCSMHDHFAGGNIKTLNKTLHIYRWSNSQTAVCAIHHGIGYAGIFACFNICTKNCPVIFIRVNLATCDDFTCGNFSEIPEAIDTAFSIITTE